MFLIKSLYLLFAAIAHSCSSDTLVSNGFSRGINSVDAELSRSCFKRWTERPKSSTFILVANTWTLTYKKKKKCPSNTLAAKSVQAFACFEKIGFFFPLILGTQNPIFQFDACLLSVRLNRQVPRLLPVWVLEVGFHKFVCPVLQNKEPDTEMSPKEISPLVPDVSSWGWGSSVVGQGAGLGPGNASLVLRGGAVPGESSAQQDGVRMENPSHISAFPRVQRAPLKSFPSWHATH